MQQGEQSNEVTAILLPSRADRWLFHRGDSEKTNSGRIWSSLSCLLHSALRRARTPAAARMPPPALAQPTSPRVTTRIGLKRSDDPSRHNHNGR
ncbi:hypothetical protein Bxe_C1367 [Paraburkholderia xenovorans LB400]|uniref:Uncharacterized protein n=1 Tax=Paraburkholderia xenovorans (strain LB400) TaxID=266265 RepID=Q13FC4_PARXL|nr:hypothetical protein Bxe_C1367 [Paraburkholderia xenovorans LB400]